MKQSFDCPFHKDAKVFACMSGKDFLYERR
jgi:hypothetical protein